MANFNYKVQNCKCTKIKYSGHYVCSGIELSQTLCSISTENFNMCTGEHFGRYAHALKFAVGLHGTQKFHSIVKYKHYQISSGARANLALLQLNWRSYLP